MIRFSESEQRKADTELLYRIVDELQDFFEGLTLSSNEEMQLSDLLTDLKTAVNQLSNI